MKQRLATYFLSIVLLLSSIAAAGQGKMYTRKVLLADFPTKTTKIVPAGSPVFETALRSEISVRWRISPYEFCPADEYKAIRSDNDYYFLTIVEDGGVAFLKLSKGGKDGETDNAKKAFDVISIPFSASGNPDPTLLGPVVEAMQDYVLKSLDSEVSAYRGLEINNSKRMGGKKVVTDPETVARILSEGQEGFIAGVIITPAEGSDGKFCYKMLIEPKSGDVYYYDKARIHADVAPSFTKAELNSFKLRNGDVIR